MDGDGSVAHILIVVAKVTKLQFACGKTNKDAPCSAFGYASSVLTFGTKSKT